jgi:hypothetical protein
MGPLFHAITHAKVMIFTDYQKNNTYINYRTSKTIPYLFLVQLIIKGKIRNACINNL